MITLGEPWETPFWLLHMAQQLDTNNMNFREHDVKLAYIKEAIVCVTFGTLVGIGVYYVFLYFNIAIFGWNLGLIFAPLGAGYAETVLANRMIGQGIGAISSFILFVITTVYSFIIVNPTLGLNLIDFGKGIDKIGYILADYLRRRRTGNEC